MKKKFPILMITLLLSSAVSLSTRAASPEFARTPEEWAVLRDNTLSWEEIPDLVNEYNATVLANEANMSSDGERLRDAAHTNADLSDMADQYEVMAAEAEGMTGGTLQAASFRMMADQLRSQASENTSDYRVLCVEYDRAEAEIVKNARSLFIAYHRGLLENALTEKNIAYLSEAVRSAQNRKNYGMATELDVLTATENLQKAQAQLVTGTSAVSETYGKLITLCGWQADQQAEIGPVPWDSLEQITAVDREQALSEALEASFTLKADRLRIENARTNFGNGDVTKKAESRLRADENTVKNAFASSYDALMLSVSSYDSACAAFRIAAEELAQSTKGFSLGTISAMDLRASENAYEKASFAKDSAFLSLLSARSDFDLCVKGL